LWQFEYSTKFVKQYGKLDPDLKTKVDDIIEILEKSEDPRKLGVFKQGRLRGVYAYELGKKYRLLYNPRFNDMTIELIRVGDHKDVYGFD